MVKLVLQVPYCTIGHTSTNADVPLPVVASTHVDTRDIAVLGSTYHSVRTDMYAHPILVYRNSLRECPQMSTWTQ